jgi:hypothetical protein
MQRIYEEEARLISTKFMTINEVRNKAGRFKVRFNMHGKKEGKAHYQLWIRTQH